MKVKDLEITPPKVILYGSPGAGKTALALTCGECAQVIDLDNGLRTALHLQDEFSSARLEVDAVQFLETDPSKPTAFRKLRSYVFDLVRQTRQGMFTKSVLIVDSLTALADVALSFVLDTAGKVGKSPEIQHWGMAFMEIEQVIAHLRALPIAVILICHDQRVEFEGENIVEIALPGQKLTRKITRYFDEIFYMRTRGLGGNNQAYVIQTLNTSTVLARSRCSIPNLLDTKCGMLEIFKKMGYDAKGVWNERVKKANPQRAN